MFESNYYENNETISNKIIIHLLKVSCGPLQLLTSNSQGIQNIQNIQGLQNIQNIQNIQGLQNIQHIQGLQGLQGLQSLQGLQGLRVIGQSNGLTTIELSAPQQSEIF